MQLQKWQGIQESIGTGNSIVMEPSYRFPEPVMPWSAAKKWGKKIEISKIVQGFKKRPEPDRFLIVEGAGGVMVPYSDNEFQVHLMKQLGLPIIIVTEDRIGAANHSLMTIKIAREFGLDLLGLILTKSRGTFGNQEAISHFGKIEILAEFSAMDGSSTIAQVSGHPRLREIFQVSSLPS
jgi:dethiobiotin synthase